MHELPDLETLRRFDRPGPRYTSYPTAVEFHEGVDAQAYRDTLAAANRRGGPLSLYAHLPFCRAHCWFCACNVVITPHLDVADRYIGYLEREIDMVAALLPDRRRVSQLHWGGGTPTYFDPDQLERVFRCFERHFSFEPNAEIALEVDPRVTTEAQLQRLHSLGFNRLSLGVQDFTPEVQTAIGRGQTLEQTRTLIERARSIGFAEGINIDLVYGLPAQDRTSFADNLHRTLELRPDRIALYSFAYVPWIKPSQKRLDQDKLPSPELKLELYLTALESLSSAGYLPIGMDHFAVPEDELARAAADRRLGRNFMGYTVAAADAAIAFGITGIGDLEQTYFQNHKKLSTYYAAIDAGELPIEKGYRLDDDDSLRRFVITELMCNFQVQRDELAERFGVELDSYFAEALAELDEMRAAGWIVEDRAGLRIEGQGRLFIRNVAMAFDRYLAARTGPKPVFSRTV